jgi:hypothetical protein
VSLGSVIAGIIAGQHLHWCIGSKFRPCETHAWVEANGEPIAEIEATTDWPYIAVLKA